MNNAKSSPREYSNQQLNITQSDIETADQTATSWGAKTHSAVFASISSILLKYIINVGLAPVKRVF